MGACTRSSRVDSLGPAPRRRHGKESTRGSVRARPQAHVTQGLSAIRRGPHDRYMSKQIGAMETLFKALADETRLRILGLLLIGEVCVWFSRYRPAGSDH